VGVPVPRRERAELDIGRAQTHYAGISPVLEDDFIDSIDATLTLISDQPHGGTLATKYSDIPNLRYYLLVVVNYKFPYLMFYLDLEAHGEVVRVLHSRSDIPPSLQSI
jgi:toxin ParE1/3/4